MPHSTTGVPPCELLMKRRVKTRFDLLRPNIDNHVVRKQEIQARNYIGNKTKVCKLKPNFDEGDHVYFKNYSKYGPPNLPGVVEKCTGPISCKICTDEGPSVNRHFDQIFKQIKPSSDENNSCENMVPNELVSINNPIKENSDTGPTNTHAERVQSPCKVSVPELRRSTRTRKPVERLDL